METTSGKDDIAKEKSSEFAAYQLGSGDVEFKQKLFHAGEMETTSGKDDIAEEKSSEFAASRLGCGYVTDEGDVLKGGALRLRSNIDVRTQLISAGSSPSQLIEKSSFLVDLCQQVDAGECDDLVFSKLIKIIKRQPKTKSIIMELMQRVEDIGADKDLQETLVEVLQNYVDKCEDKCRKGSRLEHKAEAAVGRETLEKREAARLYLRTVVNQINILAEKRNR